MDWTTLVDARAIMTGAITYIPKVIAAIIVLTVFHVGFILARTPLRRVLKKVEMEQPMIKMLVDSILKWLMYAMGWIMAAGQLGIDVGAALAGLGVAGIAIGFAAQDTLANVIAGFIIFLDKPFRVGDWITIGDNYGRVWEITMRSTRIQTLNHTYIVIPNKNIIDEVLNNHSKYGQVRVEVPLGIAYKESIDDARDVLLSAVSNVEHVLDTPSPDVVVTELGDSSVNLVARVWIRDAEREKPVYFAVMEASKKALDKAGIEIPFPHLQLFVDDVKQKAVQRLQSVVSTTSTND